jgi:hypothetical protein
VTRPDTFGRGVARERVPITDDLHVFTVGGRRLLGQGLRVAAGWNRGRTFQ